MPQQNADTTFAYQGEQTAADGATEYNALQFVIDQGLNRISTATLAKVLKVTNTPGQVAPAGYVDVLPLVNQVDGYGNATQHGVVYGLPYFRVQGGTNAILVDPEPGDIGYVGFCDRDISSVKANKGQANPGSKRRFDMADGVYFGSIMGPPPTQYIAFTGDGIIIHDRNGNQMIWSSGGISMNP